MKGLLSICFKTYDSFKSIFILILAIGISFGVFRTLQVSDSNRLVSTIESILRNESVTTNTYALSKSLSDIESLGLIDCARVREESNVGRLFYDTSSNKRCHMDSWLGPIRTKEAEISSINGSRFYISVQPRIDSAKALLEVLVYALLILGFRKIKADIEKREKMAEARVRVIEIEKKMMLDHNRQIRHDIASPLSAIYTIMHLIPNMDSELKSVLNLAIERTRAIFDELNVQAINFSGIKKLNHSSQKIDAIAVVEEILSEKKSTWSRDVEISFSNFTMGAVFVMGERVALGRVLSNILNNSYEACQFVGAPKIRITIETTQSHLSIEIKDNGRGISSSNMSQIGKKGFSVGKNEHATAGSGLGIYSSIEILKSWSGDLKISSIEGSGTSVFVILLRAV
ncbi:MAG: sensor histidine kinase [Bacillota bacterium]